MNQESNLALLKNQVNPHFLMNTLNNIYASLFKKEPESAGIILQLSDLIRHSYNVIHQDKIAINDEINYLKNYINLEKIRLSQKIDIQFNIQVQDLTTQIPPLIFITLVENAFKHGLSELINEGFLHIDLTIQNNKLFFSVENSVSVVQNKIIESGTGLKNLEKRLEIIYPKKNKIYYEQSDTKYKVILELEL